MTLAQGLETTLLAHIYTFPSEENDWFVSINQTHSVDASLCPPIFSNACFNFFSDFDGVPDGWIDGWGLASNGVTARINVPDHEFQWGEGEDNNFNGIQDPTETEPSPTATNCFDADSDGLLDGWDIIDTSCGNYSGIVYQSLGNGSYRHWGELSFGPVHYLGQYDYNIGTTGQLTAHYQAGPTDPSNSDSDGDGLVDGFSSSLSHELALEIITASNAYTDPSAQDSDGDGLSDGMELAGWEVHIIMEKTKKEVRNWTVQSNPIKVDTDYDGVVDYSEFENQSDPTKNDTDSDRMLDGNEAQGELTQIDGKDPEILRFDDGKQIQANAIFVVDGWDTGLRLIISVRLRDNAGLDYVYVKLEGQDPIKHYFKNKPTYIDQIDLEFKFDCERSLLSGYDINVTVFDVNGNGNVTTTHIDGFAEGIVKALIKGFWSFVESINKFISELWNWIVEAFKHLFQPIINLISNAAMDIGRRITTPFINLITKSNFGSFSNEGRSFNKSIDNWDYLKCTHDIFESVSIFFIEWSALYICLKIAEGVTNTLPGIYPTIITILGITITSAILSDVIFEYKDWIKRPKMEDPASYKSTDAASDSVSLVLGIFSIFFGVLWQGKASLGAFALGMPAQGKSFVEAIFAIMLLLLEKSTTSICTGLYCSNALQQKQIEILCKGFFILLALYFAGNAIMDAASAVPILPLPNEYATLMLIWDLSALAGFDAGAHAGIWVASLTEIF